MPAGYRMPHQDELSLSVRDSDKYRYAMTSGDYNGDNLVDGALLAVDSQKKEIVLFVFLCTKNDQRYKWYKLNILDYHSLKYTGVKAVKPKKIFYYSSIQDEKKLSVELVNDSLELFQFEGSRSIFYFDSESNDFKQIWISK